MTTPDYWRVHVNVDECDVANWDSLKRAQIRDAVLARVDHYPNRTVVTFEATGYVVAVAQWLPGAGHFGSGLWRSTGPTVTRLTTTPPQTRLARSTGSFWRTSRRESSHDQAVALAVRV